MNKRKTLVISLLVLSSLLIVGCNSLISNATNSGVPFGSSNSEESSTPKYPYQHEDYYGKETATYREYYSYETGELIRLFENNAFEYIYGSANIKKLINFCGPYFSLEFDNSTSYYDDAGKQCQHVDESVFLFLYSEKTLSLIPQYCVFSDFHFLDTKYHFVYEGNTNPPYHYPKQDGDYFEFCFFLKPEIQDQQEAIALLNLNNYSSYIEGFVASKYSNCSKLYFKFPSQIFSSIISILYAVDGTSFYQSPIYYLSSVANGYWMVNIDHYGLTSSDRIKDAFLYATVAEEGHENKLFTSFDSLQEYVEESKDKIRGNYWNAADASIQTICQTIDQTIFENNNLVLTKSLVSPIIDECTIYNASYIKNGILTITFDSVNYASGATALSYRAYLITIPKEYSVNEIRIII